MNNGTIMRPLPAVIGGSLADPARMASPDPKEVAYAVAAGPHTIDIDLGAPTLVGAVYLGGVSGDVVFSLTGGTASYAEAPIGNLFAAQKRTPVGARKYLGIIVPRPLRYLRLSADLPAGFEVGVAAICERFSPKWGHEWGSGRSIIDTGTANRNRAGGFGVELGAVVTGWDFTLGDITDGEREELFDMLKKIGETRPVIVAENTDATADLDARVHYGLLRRVDKYERIQLGVTKWTLKVEDWE